MTKASATSLAPPQRLLIRGVNWLGDAVMCIPALQQLRKRLPGTHITVLTPEKLQDLYLMQPAVNGVIPFPSDARVWEVARRIGRDKFDAGLIFPNSPRSALELWLARIPVRIGYAGRWRRWLLTHEVRFPPALRRMRKRSVGEIKRLIKLPRDRPMVEPLRGAHHMHQYLGLAAALGAEGEAEPAGLEVTQEQKREVAIRFDLDEPPPHFWLGLNPGAEYGPAKRWPTDRYIDTAVRLQRETGCGWIILGGSGDRELTATIRRELFRRNPFLPDITRVDLAGKTTLPDLCAILAHCRLLLTNDTGPMHLAAAIGTPVIVPFGSTSFEMTGPSYARNPGVVVEAKVPCSPCFRRTCPIDFRCMNSISVEQVVQAALAALAQERM